MRAAITPRSARTGPIEMPSFSRPISTSQPQKSSPRISEWGGEGKSSGVDAGTGRRGPEGLHKNKSPVLAITVVGFPSNMVNRFKTLPEPRRKVVDEFLREVARSNQRHQPGRDEHDREPQPTNVSLPQPQSYSLGSVCDLFTRLHCGSAFLAGGPFPSRSTWSDRNKLWLTRRRGTQGHKPRQIQPAAWFHRSRLNFYVAVGPPSICRAFKRGSLLTRLCIRRDNAPSPAGCLDSRRGLWRSG